MKNLHPKKPSPEKIYPTDYTSTACVSIDYVEMIMLK
jgi:hypothetical protein